MTNPALRVTPDVVLHATSNDFSVSGAPADSQITSITPGPSWSLAAGDGVGVALIDTGVNPTADLRGDRLVRGPDLSGERDGVDRFGHGTFMAGLIAGDGTASSSGGARHVGAAPGATVVSVKVAGADGSTSLSKLIGGIGWVIAHEDDYDIGVLNLSFGANVNLPYLANPLSGAVEAAWASGITVVTSAGNDPTGVTSPGDDPWVVTVGSTDTTNSLSAVPAGTNAGNTVAAFSGRERFARYSKPDVLAPGVSVVSLRAPGSKIDVANPNARIGSVYFRGSGTSMSTALVSGAAAVLLDQHPDATPDDVKGALLDGGVAIKGSTAPTISINGATQAPPRADWWQRFPIAFGGLGRGFLAMPWTASKWTASKWTASKWTASKWTASKWTASKWTDSDWNDAAWADSRWTASKWTDASWNSLGWG
jgi:serine protease AprX